MQHVKNFVKASMKQSLKHRLNEPKQALNDNLSKTQALSRIIVGLFVSFICW